MALYPNYPLDEVYLNEGTTSVATTPVAAQCIAPCSGYVARGYAGATGTTTGTTTIAVTINGGSDIFGGGLTIPAGSGNVNVAAVPINLVGAGTTSGVHVNEGDTILFTPSGGTGSNIGAAFTLVIRKDP